MLYSAYAGDVRQGGSPFSGASVDSLLQGDDDVLRDAAIQEMSQAVFSGNPLGGYISGPFNAKLVSVGNEPVSV
jgi:hypothetical protein